jgi:hypothetical protein
VLDSAEDRHAGLASGVNNAIARAAGLLAVAVIPAAVGLSGDDYAHPAALSAGFSAALLVSATMLVAGAVLAFTLVRGRLGGSPEPTGAPAPETARPPAATTSGAGPPPAALAVHRNAHCPVAGPALHPRDRGRA